MGTGLPDPLASEPPRADEVEEVIESNGWQWSIVLDFAVLAGSIPEQA